MTPYYSESLGPRTTHTGGNGRSGERHVLQVICSLEYGINRDMFLWTVTLVGGEDLTFRQCGVAHGDVGTQGPRPGEVLSGWLPAAPRLSHAHCTVSRTALPSPQTVASRGISYVLPSGSAIHHAGTGTNQTSPIARQRIGSEVPVY